MKINLVKTNECEVRIEPRKAGDLGVVFVGRMERTPQEEYSLCQEIRRDIERHVDNVGYVYIYQAQAYETEDGIQHENLYDALEHLFDDYGGLLPNYGYQYKRPSDDVYTRGYTRDFRKLIEEAWRNPWGFEVTGTPLTENQAKFLEKVLAESPHKYQSRTGSVSK